MYKKDLTMANQFSSIDDAWFIYNETFENFKTYEHIFTDFNRNQNKGNLTTTVHGNQKDINLEEYPLLIKDITNKVNECFRTNELPFSVNRIDNGWWISYNKYGFQALHRHQRSFSKEDQYICTALIGYDTVTTDDDWGQFYGIANDQYFQFGNKPGNLIIFDSKVWHGVYPVQQKQRRIMAFDIFYNVEGETDDTN